MAPPVWNVLTRIVVVGYPKFVDRFRTTFSALVADTRLACGLLPAAVHRPRFHVVINVDSFGPV